MSLDVGWKILEDIDAQVSFRDVGVEVHFLEAELTFKELRYGIFY